jgi:cytochrome c oxidase subunit 4
MAHTDTTAAHDAHAHTDSSTKSIWRTFWILLGITVVEVAFAFLHLEAGIPPRWILNGIFIVLTVVKAFYIVAEFMHLRHEIKNLILTVLLPLLLFVWFIIAFLVEGNSWKNMIHTLSPGTVEQVMKVNNEAGHH